MSNSFVVYLSGLRRNGQSKRNSVMPIEASEELGDLVVSSSRVPEGASVSFRGSVEPMNADDAVVVSGTVTAPWEGQCRRCLEPARGEVVAEVREIFEPDPTEGETYPLAADSVKLEPLVREAVMLGLPQAPLCKADCAGLCAECGANRNDGDCGCRQDTKDPRWAALDALRDPNA